MQVNQQALGVVATNIANANTEGYVRRELPTVPSVLDGDAVGVTSETVQRIVDESLVVATRQQSSAVGYTKTVNEYYDGISLFLGDPGKDNSLSYFMDEMFTSFTDLSNTPDSASLRNTALNNAESVANNVSSLANNIEQTRYKIDQEISGKISDVNNIIDEVFSLNEAIREAAFSDINVNAFLDRRDMLLEDITQIIDVSVTVNNTNEVSLAVSSGEILSPGQKSHLFYAPASSQDDFTHGGKISAIYAQQVGVDGKIESQQKTVLVSSSSDEPALQARFSSGELKGLLDMRDEILPAMMSQLDELAYNLADAFNVIQNQGAGFPPPTQMTGTNALTIDQNFLFAGEMRVALVDVSGQPIADAFGNGNLPPFTMDFGDYTGVNGNSTISVKEFIDEFNNYYGSPPSTIVNLGPFRDIDIAATSNVVASTEATGSIEFSTSPGVGDTISIDGTVFTFVANGTPSGASTIEIGTSLSSSINEIVKVLNGSTAGNVADATYSRSPTGDTLVVTHDVAGTTPNGTFALDANVTNGGGTANINGVGAAANPAASALGLGTGTVGANATGTFSFDLEMFNYTGDDATFEVLGVDIDGNPTGATMAAQTIEAGDRARTAGSVSVTLPGTLGEGGVHTFAVQVRSTDSDGVVQNSVIEYQVTIPDPNTNILNNRYGYSAVASGDATTQAQIDNNAFAVAKFVDADGKTISASDTVTEGFLQITTDKGKYGIVFDEMDSRESGENGVQSQATNRGFSHFFGMNDFFVLGNDDNQALGFGVREEYQGNPASIATGSLSRSSQPVEADADPIYTYEVGLGSNQIANALATLRDQNVNFNTAGGIPAISVTFNQYSAEILSFFVADANVAKTELSQAELIYDTFRERVDSVSGVNVDEELANTVIYQNNYAASARLVSVISELFETLVASL